MYGLESATRQLMADMRANAQFKGSYEAKKGATGDARPAVIVGDIKNGTTSHVQNRLNVVRDTVVRTELLNSGLFTILSKDAEAAPDYVVMGDFRDIPESDGRHNHYLYIRIKDVKTDVIIWEGVKKNVKL